MNAKESRKSRLSDILNAVALVAVCIFSGCMITAVYTAPGSKSNIITLAIAAAALPIAAGATIWNSFIK